MAMQILLNLGIALIWMFFHNSYSVGTFTIGYLIGIGLILVLRRFIPGRLYFGKLFAIFKLILMFIRELILSSLNVAKEILRPRMIIRPGIIAVPTQLRTDIEVTLFACLITLTPGTLTLEISPDNDVLYLHCIDIHDVQESVDAIKNTFEKAIMEVSR